MHKSFLPYLADPKTGEPLALEVERAEGDEVIEGSLRSASNRYPIVRGVPRFAGDEYAASFGYQWNRWARVQFESENRGKPMQGHTKAMWERITGLGEGNLAGSVIAEFGCGPGRFLEVVRMKGGRAIGLDLSSAVEAAAENFKNDPDVLICQADILHPPIKSKSLDGSFSIGVLHHTPDPQGGFQRLAASVKPGGWVSVAVYGKGGYYDFPTVTVYRRLFKFLWPIAGHYPPLAYAYFACYVVRPCTRIPLLGSLLKVAFPHVRLPDADWSVLDTFDSVTPSYQSTHESYEVFQWFKRLGLVSIEPSDWSFTSYHGRIGQSS